MTEDIYSEIRPYNDEEVIKVITRLLGNTEFIDTFARYKLGLFFKALPDLCSLLVRFLLARQFKSVENVADMQAIIRSYMDKMIRLTTSELSVSGLDELPRDKAYLFVSNHRDIAMDPAFINYALYSDGRQTARIAVGDNLLSKTWVSDVMRLNKSFVVKRSAAGPRELISAMRLLSQYIADSVTIDKTPVWLAQKEGRAKDGNDRTDPAIIKMLDLSRNKKEQMFSHHIAKLRIVPVAISYEIDPCVALKAHELYEIEQTGCYHKDAHEDITSIGRGITGEKGKVSVSFGKLITANLSDPMEVSREIDKQIIAMYELFPNNLVANELIYPNKVSPYDLPRAFSINDYQRRDFLRRIEQLPSKHQKFAYYIYANPVQSWLEYNMKSTPQ